MSFFSRARLFFVLSFVYLGGGIYFVYRTGRVFSWLLGMLCASFLAYVFKISEKGQKLSSIGVWKFNQKLSEDDKQKQSQKVKPILDELEKTTDKMKFQVKEIKLKKNKLKIKLPSLRFIFWALVVLMFLYFDKSYRFLCFFMGFSSVLFFFNAWLYEKGAY